MYFSSNIKFLRKHRGRTQDETACALDIKRSTLSGYENQISEPNIDTLISFSRHFNIDIDTLIKVDLSSLSNSQLSSLEHGNDDFLRGDKIRILATTVDGDDNENIELVTEKAKAGYTTGFADPDFIRILPTFHMPFLSREKKYRTFQISGDSMLPIPEGSFVTGEYLLDWNDIRNGYAYIIVTREDGIVFKIANGTLQNGMLPLCSLNPLYQPYELPVDEIREVWKFVHYISAEIPEDRQNTFREEALIKTVKELQKKVEEIQLKLNL